MSYSVPSSEMDEELTNFFLEPGIVLDNFNGVTFEEFFDQYLDADVHSSSFVDLGTIPGNTFTGPYPDLGPAQDSADDVLFRDLTGNLREVDPDR